LLFLWGTSEFNDPLFLPSEQAEILKYKDENNYDCKHKLIEISLGRNHIIALNDKKQLLTWGCNQNFALGNKKLNLGKKIFFFFLLN
jgi:alpha-tubulin suppressor-like RCC1 family protein